MLRSRSFIATPPETTIKEQLTDRDMSQKEFAARMDMSEKHISRLINGEVQLTPNVALKLEMVFGISTIVEIYMVHLPSGDYHCVPDLQ